MKYQIDRSLDNGGLNNSQSEDYINRVFADFESTADRMKQNFNAGTNISGDVQEVLNRAAYIENFMRDYRFNSQATNTWNLIKRDLTQLSRYYNVSWNWNGNYFPNTNAGRMLTGTYRLNSSRSDDVNRVIEYALSNIANRERMRQNLQRRLAVPEYIAIERSSNTITMASSNAARSSFEANGRTIVETMPNGRRMSTRATIYGNRLEITSDGDQTNAFFISFEPINNGDSMRVTRRLNLERRGQTITVVSVYDRTSNVAQWNLYNNDNADNSGNNANNAFYVPNGTRVVATLDTRLSTRQSNTGDRFVMTVVQPAAYQGATIEGTIGQIERSGRLTGRAEMNLNFETIRLRNGSTYRFEGLIDRITTLNGRSITVDNEESVRGSSQTRDTVVRTGIGAVIGAIIGGIAGGGEGAAVGAAIGAGAGGGSVLIQGRGDLELDRGSTFEIRSSAPGNVGLR